MNLHTPMTKIVYKTPAESLAGVEYAPKKRMPLKSPKAMVREDVMSLSMRARELMAIYMVAVEHEEHPAEYRDLGYTPHELGLIRRKAHEKLMQQLRKEGIDCSDRAAITEMARRAEQWFRE